MRCVLVNSILPGDTSDTSCGVNTGIMHSIVYLQVSILGQALVFVTRTKGFSWMQMPSLLLLASFVGAQVVATFIAVYADWGFTNISGAGWGWALVVWVCVHSFQPYATLIKKHLQWHSLRDHDITHGWRLLALCRCGILCGSCHWISSRSLSISFWTRSRMAHYGPSPSTCGACTGTIASMAASVSL